MTVLSTIPLTTNNETTNTDNNELNDTLRAIRGVLETAISTKTVLNTDEISEVLGAIRGVLETITEPDENENEVLIDTLFSVADNDTIEAKTWTEECFLDRMGASQELKEWADSTSDSFFEEHSDDIWNVHPDQTTVRVPVRFHKELRKLGMNSEYRSAGTYLWAGVWYYPIDREFLELVDSE